MTAEAVVICKLNLLASNGLFKGSFSVLALICANLHFHDKEVKRVFTIMQQLIGHAVANKFYEVDDIVFLRTFRTAWMVKQNLSRCFGKSTVWRSSQAK